MEVVQIPLDKLRAHRANANVMSDALLAKLAGHIERSGRYEPLIVRPHPREATCYELINGHHRKLVLERLGHSHANCLVWEVSDNETLMLLASINRLSGRDDPSKRAALLDKLSRRYEKDTLIKRLPEDRERLEKLLAVNRLPIPVRPEAVAAIPIPISFFVTAKQQALIQRSLTEVRRQVGGDDPQSQMSRGDLLAVMADAYLKTRVPGNQ